MKKFLIFILIIFNFNSLNAKDQRIDENKIFKNLRCLVCQGQSVADSNSEFAQTIKTVVKDNISSGKSEKEIYEFLIDKYGEWIVYEPLFNKFNFLLWTLPYIFLLVSGWFIFFIIKKSKHNKAN